MPDVSAVVVIPTNKVTVNVSTALSGNAYSGLINLGTYAVLATHTYSFLQSLGGTLGDIFTMPTGKATVQLGLARTLATYGNLASSFFYANYGAMNGMSYGQLQVLP